VGILVFTNDEGPRLAAGVPDPVRIGSVSLGVSLDRGLSEASGVQREARPDARRLGSGDAPARWCTWVVAIRRSSASDTMRRAAAAFVRAAGRSGRGSWCYLDRWRWKRWKRRTKETGAAAQAVAEGAVLASYRFVGHKSEDDGGRISRLVVLGVGLDPGAARRGIERGSRIARAVSLGA